jgi:hypothetical protein
MKAINHEATVRGGSVMFDREKGFNLIIEKSGKERSTNYKASKGDYLPMPEKYYTEAEMVDVIAICKAAIFTPDYADMIIGNYLYGEELPDKTDEHYQYPEIRESLKKKSDEAAKKNPPATGRRPRGEAPKEEASRRPATAEDGTKVDGAEETAAAEPAAEPATPTRSGSARPPRSGRPGRNVSEDLKDV